MTKIIDHDTKDGKEHAIKRIIAAEANEVHLINCLANSLTDWVKDMRFTSATNLARIPTEDELSAVPVIYKYYFPRARPTSPEINLRKPQPPESNLYPAIIVQPSSGNDDTREDGVDYNETKINIIVLTSERDLELRYGFLLLAKSKIVQELRHLPSGLYQERYQYQNGSSWDLFDDEQIPNSGISITTTWRYFIPRGMQRDFESLFYK